MRADLECPVEESARRPFEMGAVGFGHVFRDGRVSAPALRARMHSNALSAQKTFDGGGRQAHVEFAFDQGMRDAVVMPLDLDVIINVDARLLPFGELPGLRGQRATAPDGRALQTARSGSQAAF